MQYIHMYAHVYHNIYDLSPPARDVYTCIQSIYDITQHDGCHVFIQHLCIIHSDIFKLKSFMDCASGSKVSPVKI